MTPPSERYWHQTRCLPSLPAFFPAHKRQSPKCGSAIRNRQWAVDSGRWAVVGGRWSVVGGQWSVAGGRWSVVGGQWSVVSCQWSVCGGQWSMVQEKRAAFLGWCEFGEG